MREKRNVKRKLSVAHRSITYEVIMTDNNRDVCVSSEPGTESEERNCGGDGKASFHR